MTYKNILDEWFDGRHEVVALEPETYKPIYNGILIGRVDHDVIERNSLQERLVAWARPGTRIDAGTPARIPTTIPLKLAPEAPPEQIPGPSRRRIDENGGS